MGWDISQTGAWIGEDVNHHHDKQLSIALVEFFTPSCTVLDLGCGKGFYVQTLRDANIEAHGIDGNPITPKWNQHCWCADLSVSLQNTPICDWVLSLEVGEHIPKQFESIFIDNVHRHNRSGIILSWAVPGQGGDGHFNEQPNHYVRDIIIPLGYYSDLEAEKAMRKRCDLPWFHNTLMIFRRQ